jgi:hypothetical protein
MQFHKKMWRHRRVKAFGEMRYLESGCNAANPGDVHLHNRTAAALRIIGEMLHWVERLAHGHGY